MMYFFIKLVIGWYFLEKGRPKGIKYFGSWKENEAADFVVFSQ